MTTEATRSTHSTRVTRTLRATPEEVFAAWTEPDQLCQWSCPEGATIDDVQVDLRVGGAYRIRMRGPEGESYTAFGLYREIDPPNRLVYTWDWEEAAHQVGETLVSVDLQPAEESSTDVTVTHSAFPTVEAADGHTVGWTSCCDRLERLLGTG